MSNQQQLTEAIWALTNELRLFREHRPAATTTEPSHTGAAPVTSGEFRVGDWVRVIGPDDDPLIGKVGRVRLREQRTSLIDFPDLQSARFNHAYLEPAPKPDSCTPRH